MRTLLVILGVVGFFSAALGGDDFHARTNTIYKDLLAKGIAVTDTQSLKLPAPAMPDGLDKAGQLAALKQLAGDDYQIEDLVRAAIVAPHIFKFRELDASATDARGRAVGVWFVAHGNLDKLTTKTLQTQFASGSARVTSISDADLLRRKIKVKAEPGLEESYMHGVGTLLDRVRIHSTNHGMISRGKDSIVAASRLDTRFTKDADFPNLWRSVSIKDDGKEELGPVNPYEGAGGYIRLTRLHEPPGAIFVEVHQVFLEPKKWFDAPNMLKSKLPIVIQSEVRAFRKDLTKLSK